MIKNFHEIFAEIEAAPDLPTAQKILRDNVSPAMRELLRANYHPDIHFDIDEIPPYTPSDAPIGMGITSIYKEVGRLYLFNTGNPRVDPNLTLQRKKELLVQILEGLEAKEAEIYANVVMKRLQVKYLTKETIQETFPVLFSINQV